MTTYDLHVSEVNFQHVPVYHVLQVLTRQFGGKILVDTIQMLEGRDRYTDDDGDWISNVVDQERVLQ